VTSMKHFLCLCILVLVPCTASAEQIVERMVGVWVGEGTVRPHGLDDPEKIRCKVNGELLSEVQVKFAGRCATASGAGGFRLLVAQNEAGSLFAAQVRFANSSADIDFKGDISEEKITLSQVKSIEESKRRLRSSLDLVVPQDADISLVNTVTDLDSGEQAQSLKILFVRQN